MYKLFSLLILAIALMATASGQTSTGNYRSGFKRQGQTVYFSNENADVRLEFCTPSMFRVRTSWSRAFEANEPWMVINYNWAAFPLQTAENSDHFLIQTASLDIKIHKTPFRIDVLTKDGKVLSSESAINGGATTDSNAVISTKQMMPDEHFFGFGERMDFIDQRNKKIRLNVGRGKGRPHAIGAYNIQEANYSPVPFFMSTRGYGIFLHNSYATEWDMGLTQHDRYSFKAVDGELDYYFMYGPDLPTVLAQYTSLTGKPPMLPQIALGLHVGTYSGGTWGHDKLTSQSYVVALAKKFRELGIPADLLWLDSTWRIFGKVGGNGATSFEWRDSFKDPKNMFDSVYALNYKMVGLHLRPRLDNGIKLDLLDQARKKGFVYPEPNNKGEFVNFFDQKSVNWWWNNGVMKVAALGAMFLKTDEGSAFGGLANESNKTGPTDKAAQKLHNVFPIAYAKAPYEKFQEFNKVRGLNQTREGYAGIQRYPYIFAGDWPSEWQYFAPVIKAGINIGLSGVSYWSHCMGGFERPADPELYIRWVQFGMFSPVAMVFGMDHSGYKEPWNYGEQALANFKKYDLLRYRLIPYIYSNFHVSYTTGLPIMRALVLEHQDDENVYDIGDQYMFGNNMMVCPVTTKGAVTRSVYLPEGTWFDYWTGKKHNGKQYVHVVAPLDTIPVFVKAGAIIPMQPEMSYSGEKPVDLITLDIFPSSNSVFNLYEDDGLSLKYQQAVHAVTKITASLQPSSFMLDIDKPVGKFKPVPHQYLAKIHWDNTSGPSSITENGQSLKETSNADALKQTGGWYYDVDEKILWVKAKATNSESITLAVHIK